MFENWRRAVVLILLGAAVAGCANVEPGAVSLSFSWVTRPADGTALWVAIRVEDRDGATLAAAPAVPFTVGAASPLPGLSVPNGVDRRVVVELREREALDARVLYFGRSAPFALEPGQRATVAVALALQRPATEAGNTLRIVLDSDGGGLADPAELAAATLRFETEAGRAVELSNDPSLRGARIILLDDGAEPDLRCAVAGAFDADCPSDRTCCELGPWDITAGVTDPPADGVYSVFARFLDANGYASPLVVAKVQVDNAPPVIVYNTVTPAFGRAGQEVVVSVTANEPLAAATLTVTPEPVGFAFSAPESDGTTWRWRSVIPETDDDTDYQFSVDGRDRVGNPLGSYVLRDEPGDPGSAPLTLAFDASRPVLGDLALTVSDDVLGSRTVADQGTARAGTTAHITVSFTVSEDRELAGPPRVSIADAPIVCDSAPVDATTTALTCAADAAAVLSEGAALVTIEAADVAGNEALAAPFLIVFDVTPPARSGAATIGREPPYPPSQVAPDEATINAAASARVAFAVTEPLGRAPVVMVDGQPFAPATWSEADTFFVVAVPGAALAEARHLVTAELVDLAGNLATVDVGAVVADSSPPAALLGTPSVTLYRAPFGVDGAPTPHYELRACPGPWAFCADATPGFEPGATVAVFGANASGCAPLQAASFTADDAGGGRFALPLATASACVQQTDRAGNVGPLERVAYGQWRGSLRQTLGATVLGNPLALTSGARFGGLLFGQHRGIAAGTLLEGADGALATTTGASDWSRLDAYPYTPEGYFAAMTFDRARGVGLRFGECWYDDDEGGCYEWGPTNMQQVWNGYSWTLGDVDRAFDGLSGPPDRYASAVAYDSARAETLLFGGRADAPRGDTWRWDGAVWERLVIAGPSARSHHALIYDAAHHDALLFGGCTAATDRCATSAPSGELWRFDAATPAWTKVEPAGAWPSARWGHALAYDEARGVTVLFGGHVGSAASCDGVAGELCNATWLWDGATWTKRTAADQTGAYPSARYRHAMTYDVARQRVVMVGCQDPACTVGDTWEWDGAQWSRVTPTGGDGSPEPRYGQGLAYDTTRGVVVMQSGQGPESCWRGVASSCTDTWTFDGQQWRRVYRGTSPNTNEAPLPRDGTQLVYDPVRDKLIMYGGVDADDTSGELNEWADGDWTSVPSTPAGQRTGHVMAYSAVDGGVLVQGGRWHDAGAVEASRNDLWLYDGTWSLLDDGAGVAPLAVGEHAAAYDAARGELVLFGGAVYPQAGSPCPGNPDVNTVGRCIYAETWVWASEAQAWRHRTASATRPSGRHLHAMAYDVKRGRTVLFGGFSKAGVEGCTSAGQSTSDFCYLGDTWLWDGASWTRYVPPAGAPYPDPRARHAMVWDPVRETVLLFGGRRFELDTCDGAAQGLCEELWEFGDDGWQVIPTADLLGEGAPALPGVEFRQTMAWDTTRDVLRVLTPSADKASTLALGQQLWVWNAAAADRPVHQLTVPATALDIDAFEVVGAEVRWDGGGTGHDALGAPAPGAALYRWREAGWERLAQHGAGADAPATLTWAATGDDAASAFSGPGAALHLAVVPTTGNGAGQDFGRVTSDYVEVEIRYREIAP